MKTRCNICAARSGSHCGFLGITLTKEKVEPAPCENAPVHTPRKKPYHE